MTDKSEARHPDTRDGVNYEQIECPFCVAYFNQPCRNPKTRVLRPKGVYCGVRVVQVNLIEDERTRRAASDLENARNALGANKRVEAFMLDYEQLVKKHGLALSHQDTQGAFIITDKNQVSNLTWAFCAIAQVGKQVEPSAREYESFGDFLSNRE